MSRDRRCPSCDEAVTDLSVCPSCQERLYSVSQPFWKASLIAFFYGGLVAGFTLFFIYLAEALTPWEPREVIKLGIAGVAFLVSGGEKFKQVRVVVDNAVSETALSETALSETALPETVVEQSLCPECGMEVPEHTSWCTGP